MQDTENYLYSPFAELFNTLFISSLQRDKMEIAWHRTKKGIKPVEHSILNWQSIKPSTYLYCCTQILGGILPFREPVECNNLPNATHANSQRT